MKITKNQLRKIIREEKQKLLREASGDPKREAGDLLAYALGGMDELRHRLKVHIANPESMSLDRVDSIAEEVELRIKGAMEAMDMYVPRGRG